MKKTNYRYLLLRFSCLAFFLFCIFGICLIDTIASNTDDKKENASFNDELYELRNPKTRNSMIVDGNGKVIIRTIDPDTESVGLIRDFRTNKANYIYKVISGENVNKKEYSYDLDGEHYTYVDESPTYRTIYYDREGRPIDFETNTYSAYKSLNDYILMPYESYEDSKRNRKIYDAKEKKLIEIPGSQVEFFGDHLIYSTEDYNVNDVPKKIIVVDDDLKEIKRFDDYSFIASYNFGGVEVAKVCKKVLKETLSLATNSDADVDEKNIYDISYNFLDNNLNLIFEESTDTNSYDCDTPIVTMHSNDKEFEYDFKNNVIVGDVRNYTKKLNDYEEKEIEKKKYDGIVEQIKMLDEKYQYVSIWIHDGKVLFQADYRNTKVEDDWKNCSDFYDIDKNLIKTFEYVNFVEEKGGRIFVNNCECYDFDFNLLKTFDNKTCFERYEFNDKMYYSDLIDETYNKREKGTLYDVDLNPIFTDVEDLDFYVIENSVVVIDKEGTKICDKDLNVIKSFDRKIEFRNWYNNTMYMAFHDLTTNLYGIITKDYKIIIDNLKNVDSLTEKHFTFQNGFRYGFMNYKGEVLLSFSIFDSMNDDYNDIHMEGDIE